MKKVFCPFVNGDCVNICVFHNSDSSDNGCNLSEAVLILQSFKLQNKTLENHLTSIENNTGSDHTYSFEIKTVLTNILSALEK